jgi:glycosyltransferase involved in cell wall biosynthesis
MQPKICITSLEYPPDMGGVGESVHRIAHLLLDLGYEVHVAVFHSKYGSTNEVYRRHTGYKTEMQDGVFVHRVKPSIRYAQPTKQDFLSDIYFQLKLLYEEHRFDLFHAFFLNETGYLTTLLARENDVPVINSIRGSDLHKHIFSPPMYAQMVWTLENSSWTTFVSPDLRKRAMLAAPSIQTKASVFWNSIVPIDFSQLPAPPLLDRLQGTVIGSVGRFRDKKGIEYLIDACAVLSQETELTLLLVGDFAEKEQGYWAQTLQESNLSERIVVTGMLDRQSALAYLPYMDIFAIPSLNDGCPNAMLEAMMAGRAIVGTNVDAIGGILEDEVDGLLVQPASAREIGRALRRLMTQPELRKQFGAAAQRKVLTQLNPKVEQSNWQYVYEQVLGVTKPILTGVSVT